MRLLPGGDQAEDARRDERGALRPGVYAREADVHGREQQQPGGHVPVPRPAVDSGKSSDELCCRFVDVNVPRELCLSFSPITVQVVHARSVVLLFKYMYT